MKQSRFLQSLVLGLAALSAPAGATFHLIKIVEVFAGTPAAPNAQYVVLQMYAAGQNFVGGHAVTVYDASGALVGTFTFTSIDPGGYEGGGGDVPNGANQDKILIATSEAATFFNVSPDLVMTPVISAAGGKVCWAGTLDCVAWGSYGGSSTGVGTPLNASAGITGGKAAIRRLDIAGSPTTLDAGDDTNDSANDFYLGTPSPKNNVGVVGAAPGSTCGNHSIEGLEACDDGNTSNGDTCSSDCTQVTSVSNASPVANFSYWPSSLSVAFTDLSNDSDGSIASRSWDFGDGTTSTVTNPSKTYASAGTYSVTLTATDDKGASNGATQSVRVALPVALVNTDQYLWMVPAASNTQQQGFVRLINRGNSSGDVTVWGLDAAGRRSSGTITLTLSAHQSLQFNSQDAESGNAAKGLTGSLGTGLGNWTLIVRSALDLDALAYIRTPDGFLTSMHDRVTGDGVDWFVPFFNPAENANQVSHLRVVNTETSPVSLQITGTDDNGQAGAGTVSATLAALASADYTSSDLENGNAGKGLVGQLGNGSGKWQLNVASTGRITVQSLLYDPLGKLTNLSTIPDLTQATPGERLLWLVPNAGNTQQQGFIRIINRSASSGTVSLRGVDDAGALSPGTASFSLPAHASAQFNSQDLETGNVGKGLAGSLGDGTGDWRLKVTSDLDIVPLGLIRTPDGFLTTVHDAVTDSGMTYQVLIFNPASNPNQVSALRLVNRGASSAAISIAGIDDDGHAAPGGSVSLTLPAGGGTELSAVDLESGNAGAGLAGSFGDGSGKWWLTITSNVPIEVMSLLRDPNGYLTDLSTRAKDASSQLDP